ncbi:PREDICTED: uncharacterized protein LOC109581457 [Amphimedon queenslandica]|uniref:ZP domain-containing protein n=1 Tax=Amphimedon queenslandica TaxID=400682 RepID=A0AAN0J338_AMPQE|nr:PREDICTED: uncharacterized protein LOC109581457 [Amphimedon queenslandica]|eukprot:XP_019851136.1 PREDICTED: uncharacterized protein LOC109581457 [Amphimedon queenslandica]
MFARSFVCFLVLHFVVQSASICIQEYGTDSNCTDSLMLLVPRSRLENNDYGLLVKDFASVTGFNIGSVTARYFTVKIGNRSTSKHYGLTEKVPIPSDIGSGLLTISLNYFFSITHTTIECANESPDLYHVKVQSQYLITLQIFDNPVLHYRENPNILECQFNHPISNVLIEFKLNDKVLGYCGSYMVSPLDDNSKEISIFYNAMSDVCALKIKRVIDANRGEYACSVMIPYPTGNAFLKLNSSSFTPTSSPSPKTQPATIGIVFGAIATVVAIVIIISVIILVLHKKKLCCNKSTPAGSSESETTQLTHDSEADGVITESQQNDKK